MCEILITPPLHWCVSCRYKGEEGMAPAAYLQKYHGQGAGQASTGAQIVSTIKEATDILLTPPTSKPNPNPSTKPPKSPGLPRAGTLVSPVSPTSPRSPSPPTMMFNVSYSENSGTPAGGHKGAAVNTLASALMAAKSGLQPAEQSAPAPSLKPASTVGGAAKSSLQSAERSAPIPSPKPASNGGVAAAAAAEKQKFAPTWHSQAKPPQVKEERK